MTYNEFENFELGLIEKLTGLIYSHDFLKEKALKIRDERLKKIYEIYPSLGFWHETDGIDDEELDWHVGKDELSCVFDRVIFDLSSEILKPSLDRLRKEFNIP